ncbi:unnamed protein product [Acidithrix sp. C25]|nr:unnamed protein product [Acidithrix sp. C25]
MEFTIVSSLYTTHAKLTPAVGQLIGGLALRSTKMPPSISYPFSQPYPRHNDKTDATNRK